MIRRLYDWTLSLAGRKNALTLLAIVAFVESSIFPIPPDVLILPMVLAAREKAWKIAAVATVASVLGGLAGYAIGLFLFEAVGQPLVSFYGYTEDFTQFQALYQEWGAWIVFGAGLTPFPFKVITIASGVVALNPVVFVVAAILARGLRFYLVAALLWKYGPQIRSFIEKRLGLVTLLAFLLLIGGFAAIRLVN
ncbi:MAG: DedA family protein [Rhodospirillaceae bacterium]|nr:DedA family protein [Rhodospirillaceae bacterium]MBT5566744.1 DedA family protein [Rhodospirillaceae bacterium]MBT6090806.1 DedA family protein [Rhodospirillaceae bacterium]MBT6960728.1 DedA family protein [Rhodospirillaceae bacterium]